MVALAVGDFGPIYTETQLGRFPVEPFNTFTNIVFLLIVIRYFYKSQLNYKKFPVTVLALPILFIGFIGGTVFHATRSHSLWLILDFVPIIVLVLLAGIYFWERLLKRLWLAAVVALFFVIGLRWIISLLSFPRQVMISFSYVSLALSIIAPAILVSLQNKRRDILLLGIALLSFSGAIFFRISDTNSRLIEIFPMGTHFIWHLLGGVSTACLIEFIYRDEKISSEKASVNEA